MHFRIDIEFIKILGQFKEKQFIDLFHFQVLFNLLI
jgi:hypothetical protein